MTVNRAGRPVGPVGAQGRQARGAGPVTTRAQAYGGVTRGEPGKTGAKEDDDPGGKDDKDKVKKAKDDNPFKDDDDDKDKVEKAASAGTAGDFTPMSGDLYSDDANSDKGNVPAPNSTGVPKTPSGA